MINYHHDQIINGATFYFDFVPFVANTAFDIICLHQLCEYDLIFK